MLFPTVTFAIFFAIVLPLNWLLVRRRNLWSVFIVLASYVFYGWWNPRFVLLLAGVTLWSWLLGEAIARAAAGRRKLLLAVAVGGDLGVLAYFKYVEFFLVSTQNALNDVGLSLSPWVLRVTLPVGVSFFTFQALSYVIDVYRGKVETVGLRDFAVYISFFPHLEAGPIVRASEFLPQLRRVFDPQRVEVGPAFFLIMSGLFKKVVLSDLLSSGIVDPVFRAPSLHSGPEVLVGVYAYAAQIYCDFSGYTDIAIGLALLLGIRFPQNFDGPYRAVSLQDFWRRWHMTLSRFLRDYLYIPLGGNRKGRRRTYVNLMATMLLGGLWHGAAWTFVAWGGLHGGVLSIERWRADRREERGLPEPPDTAWRRWRGRLVTFNVVCLGWVFFRATSFGDAWSVLSQIPQGWGDPAPLITTSVVLCTIAGIGCQYLPQELWQRTQALFGRIGPVPLGAALAGWLFLIDVLGPQGVAPFIYYAF